MTRIQNLSSVIKLLDPSHHHIHTFLGQRFHSSDIGHRWAGDQCCFLKVCVGHGVRCRRWSCQYRRLLWTRPICDGGGVRRRMCRLCRRTPRCSVRVEFWLGMWAWHEPNLLHVPWCEVSIRIEFCLRSLHIMLEKVFLVFCWKGEDARNKLRLIPKNQYEW